MADTKPKFQSVDEYISSFPKSSQEALGKIRQTVKKAVPQAEEVISYGIPAFKFHGFLVYFSAYKAHYSLSFPPPFTLFDVFKTELSEYEKSKTTIQLPMDKALPIKLISDIVKYRAKENQQKDSGKKKS